MLLLMPVYCLCAIFGLQVLDNLLLDIMNLLGLLIRTNKEAEGSVQKVLASAKSQGAALKQDVQKGAKTAVQAADELSGIVRAALDAIRGLLLKSGAAEASENVAGIAAEAAAAISDALARSRPAGVALLQMGQVQVSWVWVQGAVCGLVVQCWMSGLRSLVMTGASACCRSKNRPCCMRSKQTTDGHGKQYIALHLSSNTAWELPSALLSEFSSCLCPFALLCAGCHVCPEQQDG